MRNDQVLDSEKSGISTCGRGGFPAFLKQEVNINVFKFLASDPGFLKFCLHGPASKFSGIRPSVVIRFGSINLVT